MITLKYILFYLFGCITGFSVASLIVSAKEDEGLRKQERALRVVEDDE